MSKIFKYKVFNLILHSLNLEIPELQKTSTNQKPDIIVKKENSILWPPIPKNKENTYFISIAKEEVRITIEGIGYLRITNGNQIAWEKLDNVPERDIINIILSSGLGTILIQKNIIVFHGNALAKDGKAIICLGSSGSGKSTLAYALLKEGWELIADDLVAIQENIILPGIPRIKLWHDAIRAFNIDHKKLTKVRSKIKKYILMDQDINHIKNPISFEKIYLIRSNNEGRIFKISIESQKEIFIRLRNNLFRPRFVRGLGQEGYIFKTLTNMQDKLNVDFLSLPDNINQMQKSLTKIDLLDDNKI